MIKKIKKIFKKFIEEKGSTLIEMLVALVIMGTGIVPALQNITISMNNNKLASSLTLGAQLVQSVLEEYKINGYDSIASEGDPTPVAFTEPEFKAFTYKTVVTEVYSGLLKKIETTLFISNNKHIKEFKLTTYFAKQ